MFLNKLIQLQRQIIFPGGWVANGSDKTIFQDGQILSLPTSNLEKIAVLTNFESLKYKDTSDSHISNCHIIYFYGNAMSLKDASYEFELFKKLGFVVWIPEYVGYGMSTGQASELGCKDTAITVYDYLTNQLNIKAKNIIVIGWSLGAAVAAYLAGFKPTAGLVMLSPFISIGEMARKILPLVRLIPINLLLSDNFDNISNIAHIQCPLLIVHGTDDQVIPYDMGKQLADEAIKLQKKVRFLPINGADHNNIFLIGDTQLEEEIANFIHVSTLQNQQKYG